MTDKFYWELTPQEMQARIEETVADGSFDESYRMAEQVFPPKADTHAGVAPLYYGWAIRESFLAGVRWERGRTANISSPAKP